MATKGIDLYWDAWAKFRESGFQKAMDETAKFAFADATRQVKASMQRYNKQRKKLPGAAITKRTKVKRTKGHVSKMEVRVIVGLKGTPLYDYPHTPQMVQGVGVTINKGKPMLLSHAFIATMKSGHTGIFVRGAHKAREGFWYQSTSRQKITELFTTQPAELFDDNKVVREFQEVATNAFDWSFATRLEKFIEASVK